MEKQLYQIGWQGGMTEGDVGQQTVQDIVNAELDREGKLRARDRFVANPSSSVTSGSPIDVQYISDPIDTDKVLRIVLYADRVKVFDDSSVTPLVADMAFATAMGTQVADIDMESTMFTHGSDIFITAIDGGHPIGIFHAVYIPAVGRFAIPLYTDLMARSGELTSTAAWQMIGPDGLTPYLDVYQITETRGASRTNNRTNWYAYAETRLSLVKHRVCLAAMQVHDRNVSDSALMSYATPLASEKFLDVEFGVQFVFQDGSKSKMSNTVAFGATSNYARHAVAISSTIAVSKDLPAIVAAVNVFRRIVRAGTKMTPDASFELLYTADVSSAAISANNSIATTAALNKYHFEYSTLTAEEDCSYGITGIDRAYASTPVTHLMKNPVGHRRELAAATGFPLVGGVCAYTSGWLKYSTNIRVYVPRCLIGWGQFSFWTGYYPEVLTESSNSAWYYRLQLSNAVMVFSRFAELGSNVHCVSADQSTMTPGLVWGLYTYYPVNKAMGSYENWNGMGLDLCGTLMYSQYTTLVRCKDLGSGVTNGAGSNIINPDPLMMYFDDTQAGYTAEQVYGMGKSEESVVKPTTATIGAGRMIALNVIQDDVHKKSRLSYSEFKSYSLFRKSNYIDYGPRDDGHGVALASFAGRLLVMHSTSSYILDISGGSDMAWREIGAYNDVGAISRHAVVSTAVGVFFASQGGVYYFDGDKLTKISQLEGRDVTKAYKALLGGTVRLAWRTDMRQLWVSSGGTALVFDFDRGAWHRHEFAYETVPTTDLIRFSNIAGREYSTFWHRPTGVYSFYFDGSGKYVPFSWGITTGPITVGASEIVKKAKSFYLDTEGIAASDQPTNLSVWYLGANTSVQTYQPGIPRAVKRIRFNARDNVLNFKVETSVLPGSADYWNGVIESLGLSYKPKRLK